MIEFSDVTFGWDRSRAPLFENLSMKIDGAGSTAILGASGSGKSSLLRLIAGLEKPWSGRVMMDGVLVSSPHHDRALVFQDYSLFDWMTVEANLAIAMDWVRMPRRRLWRDPDNIERDERIRELLVSFGLDSDAKKFPRQLSGGMRQRAAVARALCVRPKVLLLDEPFSALDTGTRHNSRNAVSNAMAQSGSGAVLVTHHVNDALLLCDRAIVIGSVPALAQTDVAISFRGMDESEISRDKSFGEFRNLLIAAVGQKDGRS